MVVRITAELAIAAAVRNSSEVPPFDEELKAINCQHNYVARESHFGENVLITRKGAVRAREGDLGIIPCSMGARSYSRNSKLAPELEANLPSRTRPSTHVDLNRDADWKLSHCFETRAAASAVWPSNRSAVGKQMSRLRADLAVRSEITVRSLRAQAEDNATRIAYVVLMTAETSGAVDLSRHVLHLNWLKGYVIG